MVLWESIADAVLRRMMSTNDITISEDERWFKDGVDVNSVDIPEGHW